MNSADSAKDKLKLTSRDIENVDSDSEDEIQINQSFGESESSKGSCGCLPVPFERAAPHSWLCPCFDSEILENQFKISSFKPFTKRFRFPYIHKIRGTVIARDKLPNENPQVLYEDIFYNKPFFLK